MTSFKPLRYFIEVGGQSYEAREVSGHEAMSTVFCFEAGFNVDRDFPPDPDDLIKSDATIVLMRGDLTVRRIQGIVTELSVSSTIRGVPDMHIVIEPRLSLARHRTDLRVFRNMTVPEMVVDVLSQIGVKPELRLSDSYERRPYCVQYCESDLDYVHRLMEDEGIFYFFLENDVMVLGDHTSSYEPLPGIREIPYRSGSGMDMHQDAVHTFGRRAALTVGKVSLRDFNPEHPSLNMDVEVPGPTAPGPEFYDYPGEYLEPSAGSRKARLISEAFACAAAAQVGRSFCGRFAPGFSFIIFDTPLGAVSGEQVLLSVEHRYERAAAGFSIDFQSQSAGITYRPPRNTYVPRILNPVTGFVTGPAGDDDDIHTDEYGRVKIHFHWDRRLPPDDNCSHWIPTVQDNTGSSSAIPRRDWEMLVHFMEGDPDRPVILGRVYNGEDKTPFPLPLRKTCSALKSLSTPTRDGTNAIYLEDPAGREYIQIHAERDQNVVIANDKTEDILVDEGSAVEHDETIQIGANHTMKVGRDMQPHVEGNQTWSTGGNRKRTISGAETNMVLSDRSMSVGGNHMLKIDASSATASTDMIETISGAVIEISKDNNSTQSGENTNKLVFGCVTELAEDSKAETAVKKRSETISGFLFQKAEGEMKTKAGKKRKTTVGTNLDIQSKKQLSITAVEKLKTLSATAACEGTEDITLKVQDTNITLKGGVLKIEAPSTITLKISGSNQQGATHSYQI